MGARMKTSPNQTFSMAWNDALTRHVQQETDPGLKSIRLSALERFLKTDVPSRRTEHWKYTDVSAIASETWSLPSVEALVESTISTLLQEWLFADDLNLVLVNGIVQPALSNALEHDALQVTQATSADTADLMERPDHVFELPFSDLSKVLGSQPTQLVLSRNKILPKPLHILMLHQGQSQNTWFAPRLHLQIQSGVEAIVSISHISTDTSRCLHLPVIDVDIAENASLTLCEMQSINRQSNHLSSTRVHVARDGRLSMLDAVFGAALSRQNRIISLDDPGAEADLHGLYTLRERQRTDFHTLLHHTQPHCRSRQICKGILDDHAAAVFNGAVGVAKGASGTDGYQLNRTLLRSPHAKVFTKPELEIANDDVRCSHGATVGPLDSQQVFYLQSRGIDEQAARDILAHGFVKELVDTFPSPHVQASLNRQLDRFFEGKS